MKIKEGIFPSYKPGDWVILGAGGRGWSPRLTDLPVQIADIGDHLKGTLYDDGYDFYVLPNKIIDSNEQIARSGTMGGGLSKNILRHATQKEIDTVKLVDSDTP